VKDSNLRHPACKADALPTELTALPSEIYLSIAPARNTVAAKPQQRSLLRITPSQSAPARDSGMKI
jgi:hypothetical protein